MTSLKEKVMAILEDVGDEFNQLPYEERKRISKYMSRQQIQDIWQIMNDYDDLTTKRWKKKMTKWLRNCVLSHESEWGG